MESAEGKTGMHTKGNGLAPRKALTPGLSKGTGEPRSRYSTRTLTALLLLLLSAALWIFVQEGGVNEDEGWILYAGKRLHGGALPYLDFPLFQAPLVPWLQGLWQGGDPRSLLAGRWLSALCWWFATALLCLAIGRKTGRWPLLYIIVVMGASPFVLRHAVLVKTYALTTVFISATLCCLRPGRGWALGGGLLLGLAIACRVSVVPLALVYLWLLPRRKGTLYGLAGLLVGGSIFWIALVRSGSAGLYQVVGVHWPAGPLSEWLGSRAGWLYSIGRVYPLAVAGVALATFEWRQDREGPLRAFPSAFCLWGLLFLVSAHMLPGELHADHLLVALPLAAFVGARALESSLARRPVARGGALWIAVALLQVAVGGWWVRGEFGRHEGSLSQLETLTTELAGEWPPGSRVYTTHAELAVAGGWALPEGLEMGRFSVVDLSQKEAIRRGVLNEAMAVSRLGEEAWDGAAWTLSESGGGLSAAFAELYSDPAPITDYGQFGATLYLGRRTQP